MHRLNTRYGELLGYLFSKNNFASLEEISKGIGASKATVWKDITFLESILPRGWKIEKDNSKGVYLRRPYRDTLENLWSEVRKYCSNFQTLRLVLLNNGTTLNQISKQFHISRSTAYRQIKIIQQVAERAGLELESNPYRLIGDEKRIREFYMQFWELMDSDTRSMIDQPNSIESIEFQEGLKRILSEHSMNLHTGAFQRLVATLSISNMRIAHGNYVLFSRKAIVSLRKSKYFEIADKLFGYQYIEQCQNQENQLHEILYVALHLMSEEKSLDCLKEHDEFRDKMKKIEEDILSNLLKDFSKLVGFDLMEDKIFFSRMLQVSEKILIASQFGINTESKGIIQYFKYVEEHPLFQSVERILEVTFSDIIEGEIRKEYILNAFLLLQAAILRKKNNHSVRIALIGSSTVETDYIYEVLSSTLGNQVSISLLDDSMLDFVNQDNHFDLLIATSLVDVEHVKHIPVIKISSIPTTSMVLRVKKIVEDLFFNVFDIDKKMVNPFSASASLS